ncbi:MAG: SusD/RagB family nutrient-binding outer membrane lipoprotein [Massilibacteroides sp.]|nr:SusD/RagB family nutrient-binding outer membrane lipoprotein [Massilibacteroides sp.]MDD4659575.1 SusD/RagB family nutrient-binding outer membrane lipoprotein [Massilibacteroides sp.]
MNKYIKVAFAAFSLMAFSSSCSDFGDVNIDPEHMNEGNVPYEMVFTNAQHQALGSDWDVWRNGCIYAGQWMQHLTSVDWWWNYCLYAYSDSYSAALWDGIYSGDRGAVRDITTVMDLWKEKEGYEIDYNMARIMRVYIMHRLTDLYGDIPYTEAGRPQLFSYPKYDDQKDIYADMLKELDEAQTNLSTETAKIGSHDVYFQGDAAQWKKFANSLMLRLAMRLSKVDPTTAQTWVNKAISNGLITSNNDNVKLAHPNGVTTDDSAEPYAKIFAHEDKEFFLSKTFVDQLTNTNDPRLALIGTVCENPSISIQNSDYQLGNTDPTIQKGLPGGFSINKTNAWFIGKKYSEFNDDTYLANYQSMYSVPNRYTYSDPTSPTFIVTYAQTQLLLAEAAVRGWISGNAKTYYENGVRAAMEQFSQFPNGTKLYQQYLSTDAINTYLSENPFDGTLKQINTQYWINCFCDEYESFANWRRTGYPSLQSVYDPENPYGLSATKGSIPRRFAYPSTESQVNTTHYEEAVGKMTDGDSFTSRMWWDVKE